MFGFNLFDTYEAVFEVYIGDKLVNRQAMQAPKEMLIANLIQNAQQIKGDARPIKIKMIVPDVIWDNFENKQKILNNEIAVSNSAMESWEVSNNKGENS